MIYDFDEIIDRRSSGCLKWNKYDPKVLPMFVADMDFRVAEPIIAALRERVKHNVFGYEKPNTDLAELICGRMQYLYNWKVLPSEVIFLPGIVSGLNVVCRAIGTSNSAAITFTPAYPPFLTDPPNQGMTLQTVPLKMVTKNQILRYEIDFEAFESTITASTKLLILTNPHNPVGRVFTSEELERLGHICIANNIVICSDEIHCDLILGDAKHKPIASVSAEVANRCITLMAPSKTFNISGLGVGYAIIQNADLRKHIKQVAAGILPEINVFGIAAFEAAYRSCEDWLESLLRYLVENRDVLVNYIVNYLPGIKTTIPEGTYLAWLDCRALDIGSNGYEFFLKQAQVAMSDGKLFGPEGEGFLRFNFACPRPQMLRALEQMKSALNNLP